jgi:phosphoglycolate phosphatase-like HAD superfamily hydrolase
MRMVLFDIDGTLVLTGGAGGRALRRTLNQCYGLPEVADGVRYDGKTDPAIIREVLALHRVEAALTPDEFSRVFDQYLENLHHELEATAQVAVLPGVLELVQVLSRHEGFVVGLATGNVERGAHLKLERVGLRSYFAFGGFGSDSENRTELTRRAMERGRTHARSVLERTFVIGDTPSDVRHGREAGAVTVAVASGSYSLSDLAASGADHALDSLSPLERIMEILTG